MQDQMHVHSLCAPVSEWALGGRRTGRTHQATCSPVANWRLQRVNLPGLTCVTLSEGDKHGHYLQRYARHRARGGVLAEELAQQPERGVRRAGRAAER